MRIKSSFTGMLAIVHLELIKVIRSWRYVVILLLIAAGATKATNQLLSYSRVVHKGINIWDAYFAFYGEWSSFFVTHIVPLMFIMLVGHIVISDRNSGYMYMVVSRLKKKWVWWVSKCVAAAISALIYSLSIFCITIFIGLLKGFQVSFKLSPIALYTGSFDSANMANLNVIFPPINPFRSPVNPAFHALSLILFFTISYTLIALLGILIGIYSRNVLVPAASSLFVLMFSGFIGAYITSPTIAAYFGFLQTIMLDSSYRVSAGTPAALVKLGLQRIPLSQFQSMFICLLAIILIVFAGHFLIIKKEYY